MAVLHAATTPRRLAFILPSGRLEMKTKQPVEKQRPVTGGCTGKGFLPGRSGNPGGRRKNAVSLTAMLKQTMTPADARAIVARLISLAKHGSIKAAQLIFDRLDGPQSGPMAIAMAQNTSVPTGDSALLKSLSPARIDRMIARLAEEVGDTTVRRPFIDLEDDPPALKAPSGAKLAQDPPPPEKRTEPADPPEPAPLPPRDTLTEQEFLAGE